MTGITSFHQFQDRWLMLNSATVLDLANLFLAPPLNLRLETYYSMSEPSVINRVNPISSERFRHPNFYSAWRITILFLLTP